MYNSIYPININYRKNPYQKPMRDNSAQKDASSQTNQTQNYIPQSNRINISQILTDFKNTIVAINAPDDVKDEVNVYLNLVEKESNKDNPSREIILGNLKNASKISDAYIAQALGKQSNVVEGWITTIFQQNIDLKANPEDINPDYLLKFPQKTVPQNEQKSVQNAELITKKEEVKPQNNQITITNESKPLVQKTQIESESTIELSNGENVDEIDNKISEGNIFVPKPIEKKPQSKYSPNNDNDLNAKNMYIKAKNLPKTQQGTTDALNIYNEALGLIEEDSNVNPNIRAAIHFERAKIFDEYDYVDYALRDYYEATKSLDLNLKANAFYKSGSIYDEFREFDPALENYVSSVAYSGEANNMTGQSQALSKIAGLYAKRYDSQNVEEYVNLSIDSALDSNNSKTIASAYSQGAQNYQYIGKNAKALENYKNALKSYPDEEESYEQMAYNFEQAALVMERLGNFAKAEKLRARSVEYYQLTQRRQDNLVRLS